MLRPDYCLVVNEDHVVDAAPHGLQRLRHRDARRDTVGDGVNGRCLEARRSRHECVIAGAPVACTPITRVAGAADFSQVPTPAISAPLPTGT